jgi:hypothetical protein
MYGEGRRLKQMNIPLCIFIVQRKVVSIYTILSKNPSNIGFRRALTRHKWDEWLHLCSHLIFIQLSNDPDCSIQKLTTSDVFTVKSMYEDYMNGHRRSPSNQLCS